jgi:hypothetical protein
MKQIRIFVMIAVLSMILPLASYAQEHRHSHRGEIVIVNDTDTQVSIYVRTEKYGRIGVWTYRPDQNSYLSYKDVRLRVSGDDEIEIADWPKAYIGDVAEYRDGAWKLNIRHARRELRHR